MSEKLGKEPAYPNDGVNINYNQYGIIQTYQKIS